MFLQFNPLFYTVELMPLNNKFYGAMKKNSSIGVMEMHDREASVAN
jgi:hypothetical protein